MNFIQKIIPQVSRTFSNKFYYSGQIRFLSSENNNNDDTPLFDMENPFVKSKKQCVLCAKNIEIDYKNVRLLSQFVSPFTGRLYDKHITGLCETQHRALKKEHSLAVRFGLMSPFYRDPKYNNDPPLFDPTKPSRHNPY